jgi:sodium/bile acid cotransporter 7
MIAFFSRQWFLIALISCLALGPPLASWVPGELVGSWVKSTLVFIVMLAMSLGFEIKTLADSLRNPMAACLGVAISFGLMPVAAFGVARLAQTLLGPDLASGLIVAACLPSTLASGAVWTRRGGGDDSVAILVTLITNLSCFVIVPFWILTLLGKTASLPLQSTIVNLLGVVVCPILLGQTIRVQRATRVACRNYKPQLSLFCQAGILIMVWISSVNLSQLPGKNSEPTSLMPVLLTLLLVIGLHGGGLIVGWFASQFVGLRREQQIAVSISGSQKTLMVGLKLTSDFGVSLLPIILFHAAQLILDTLVVDWWSRAETRKNTRELSATAPLTKSRAGTSEADPSRVSDEVQQSR